MLRTLFLIAAAVPVLAACEAADRVRLAGSALHSGYCEASPVTREALRSSFVFEDGSPKVVVYCEPHGG